MIRLILQLNLFCALFTLMVRYAVRNGAIDGLYFYPKEVHDRAIEIGLMGRDTMNRKRKRFMMLFYVVMLTALVFIIAFWNSVRAFRAAYLRALLFLEVMKVYDGIVIDRIWVGNSKFWLLPGCEDLPYIQTWAQVLKKRSVLALIRATGATIIVLLIVMVGKL